MSGHSEDEAPPVAASLECFLKETKSKNYHDGKDKEDDRRNPIASGRSVCVHGTIPQETSITLLMAIAHLLCAICHTDVTFPHRLTFR